MFSKKKINHDHKSLALRNVGSITETDVPNVWIEIGTSSRHRTHTRKESNISTTNNDDNATHRATKKLLDAGHGNLAPSLLRDSDATLEMYDRQIENFVGTISVPVGLVGPLSLRDKSGTTQDSWVPLATTEGALVASYNRGARAISESGGCDSVVIAHEVHRAPVFQLENVRAAVTFKNWIDENFHRLRDAAQATTRHGKLLRVVPTIDANLVYLSFRYETGEASGQNMVTIATHAACLWIHEYSPVNIVAWYIDGNFSSDKKASTETLMGTRGRRICAEVVIPESIVIGRLRSTPSRIVEYAAISTNGAMLSGQIGMNGHYANGLAALYLATGQDVACVAESAIGVSRMSLDGTSLRASVTMPAIMVGTVGGGTHLPTQAATRRVLGLPKENAADRLAEIAAALCLAGELSICAAMTEDHFAQAHGTLGRRSATNAT